MSRRSWPCDRTITDSGMGFGQEVSLAGLVGGLPTTLGFFLWRYLGGEIARLVSFFLVSTVS